VPDGLQTLIARIDAAVQLRDPDAVTQSDLVEESTEAFCFEAKGCVHAAVGSAGGLIPPFEYHTLANALDEPSITMHVHGGEMTICHVFEPAGNGRFVRRERGLSYHE
jgi:hypothetical protein